jgi:hypothetical protein
MDAIFSLFSGGGLLDNWINGDVKIALAASAGMVAVLGAYFKSPQTTAHTVVAVLAELFFAAIAAKGFGWL